MPDGMIEIYKRINDHDRRVSVVENEIKQLTPRLEFFEAISPIQRQMEVLQSSVESAARATEKQISKLANELGDGMRRLNDINEENMKEAAKSERAKHQADMALRDEKLRQIQQESEDRKFINRVKSYWTPILVLVVTGAAAFGIAVKVIEWLLKNQV